MVFRTARSLGSTIQSTINSVSSGVNTSLAAAQLAAQQAAARQAATAALGAAAVSTGTTRYLQSTQQVNNNNTTIINGASDSAIGFLSGQIGNLIGAVNSSRTNPVDIATAVANAVRIVNDRSVGNIAREVGLDFNGLIDAIEGVKDDAFSLVTNESKNIRDFVAGGLRKGLGIVEDVIGTGGRLIGIGFDKITDFGVNAFNFLKDNTAKVGNRILTTIGDAVGVVTNKANDIITTVQDSIFEGLRFTGEQVRRGIDEVKDFASGLVKNIGVSLGTVKREILRWIEHTLAAIGHELFTRFDEFERFIGRLFSQILNSVMVAIRSGSTNLLPLGSQLMNVFNKLTTNRYNSFNEIQGDLAQIGANNGLIGGALITLIGIIGIFPVLFSIAQPFAENIETLSRELARPTLLTPEVAATAFFRGFYDQQKYSNELAKLGFSDERIQAVKEASRPLLSPADIQFNYLRGNIDETTHDRELANYGFTGERIRLIKQLYNIIPGVQDLITMAVREVFSPEVAEKFGQFDNFPEDLAVWGEQQGISREWLERYWAAHWGLPSPRQGFEMLHRRIIDEDELKLLLRALDVMPFWRDNLIKLSYNPITRVDVRRIFRLGIFDRDQVYERYLDLGYSPDDAEYLTKFTEVYEAPKVPSEVVKLRNTVIAITTDNYFEQRISREFAIQTLQQLGVRQESIDAALSVEDLKRQHALRGEGRISHALKVRKMVLKAYENRAMSHQDATSALTQIGMDGREIEIDLRDIDVTVERKVKAMVADRVQELYLGYTISVTEVHTILGASNFVSDEIDELLRQMDSIRTLGTRKPTKANLDKWFDQEIITVDEYENELRGLGYNEKYVRNYLESWTRDREQ